MPNTESDDATGTQIVFDGMTDAMADRMENDPAFLDRIANLLMPRFLAAAAQTARQVGNTLGTVGPTRR